MFDLHIHLFSFSFKALTTKIVLHRPVDPVGFMINDLEQQVKDKAKI